MTDLEAAPTSSSKRSAAGSGMPCSRCSTPSARVPICGLISHYNDGPDTPVPPDRLAGVMREVLSKSLTIRGFIQTEFADQRQRFLEEAAAWIQDGRLRYKEHVVDGLHRAPAAFIDLLDGRNFGKLVVKVAP